MRIIALFGRISATGLLFGVCTGLIGVSVEVLPILLVALCAGLMLCESLANSAPMRRPWCLHRENGHVRFHRQVDQKALARLERELEIGPDGILACASRLERETQAREDELRRARILRGEATVEDMKQDAEQKIFGVFGVPGPQVGHGALTKSHFETIPVTREMWRQIMYDDDCLGIVMPPGWRIERLEPNERSVICRRDEYAKYVEEAAYWLDERNARVIAYPGLPLQSLHD